MLTFIFNYRVHFVCLFFNRQNCKSAKCKYIKCILKDTEIKSDYFVKVKSRIWSGTFLSVNVFNNALCFLLLVVLSAFISISLVADIHAVLSIMLSLPVPIGLLPDHRADLRRGRRDLKPRPAGHWPQAASGKTSALCTDRGKK